MASPTSNIMGNNRLNQGDHVATPTPPAGPNIGASRLIGTNNLQQAVDSLTTQVNRLTSSIANASSGFNNMAGASNRSTGGRSTGYGWNANSNRNNYSSNGGGANFTTGSMNAQSGGGNIRNGGGGFFGMAGGSAAGGAKFAGAVAVGAGIAAGLTSYGNRNMSSNMQMDYLGNQAALMGGVGNGGVQGASNIAMRAVFSNNYGALNAQDAAAAGYISQNLYGPAQLGGRANSAFNRGFAQVRGLGYLNPTMGAEAAANAASQTYGGRSVVMSQALGLRSPIGPGGVKNSMTSIAQSIANRTFGGQKVTQQGFAAAIGQGGSLNANLNYFGQQMGWNAQTIQEYRGLMTAMNAAQNNGISNSQFETMFQAAAGGDTKAQGRLSQFGVGSSMFEKQRNLNATRLTRQEDILESLAPAFKEATGVVQEFSKALTSLLKSTGLDKMIGTGAGWGSALSGGLSGFSSGFGMAGGVMGAARLFGFAGGGAGGAGGLAGLGAMFAGARGAAGNMGMGAFRGGAYNITSVGARGGGLMGAARAAAPLAAGALSIGVMDQMWDRETKKMFEQYWKDAQSQHVLNPNSGIFKRKKGDEGLPMPAGMTEQEFMNYVGSTDMAKLFKLKPVSDGRSGGGPAGSGGGGGSPVGGNASNTGANAAQIIKFAESQLGVPYVWGGTTPGKGLDCSGLIQWAYGQAGVKLPRVAEDQQNAGTRIPVNQAQPGDLLFNGDPAHHVVMAIGGGKIIEAPRTGLNVRIRGYNPSEFDSATRIVGSVGNIDSLLNDNVKGGKNTLSTSQSRSGGNIGAYGGTSEAEAIASALAGSIGSLPLSSGSRGAANTAGTSPIGQEPTGTGNNDKASLQAYAKQLLSKFGWGDQWEAFNALVMSESGWDVKATNPSSGAYGIPQSLPGSKMSSAGSDWQTSGETQLRWMTDYIKDRYKSPANAWSFHQKNNWYDVGAWEIDKDQKAVVHQGEMIIPAKQAETIRQALLNNTFNPNSKGHSPGNGFSIGQILVQLPQGYSGSQQDAQLTGKMIVDTIFNDSRIRKLQIGQ